MPDSGSTSTKEENSSNCDSHSSSTERIKALEKRVTELEKEIEVILEEQDGGNSYSSSKQNDRDYFYPARSE